MAISKTCGELLESIDGKLCCVEQQMNQLREVVSRFHRSDGSFEGGSCLVYGERGSGRNSVVSAAIADVRRVKGVVVNRIEMGQLANDSHVLDALLDGDVESPRVVVVGGADELAARARQTLLYKLLNTTRTSPWLVFLLIDRQDFVSVLEKRVRSRVGTQRVQMRGADSPDQASHALRHMITNHHNGKRDSEWNAFVDRFLGDKTVKRIIENNLFEVDNSFGTLKQCAAVWLAWMAAEGDEEGDPLSLSVRVWCEAVHSTVPHSSPLLPALRGLSLRAICVLLCVLRRLNTAPAAATLTYKKVAVDYQHLSNRADHLMAVSSDLVVYKELDRLVELRVLHGDASGSNMAYRRVSIGCRDELKKAVDERTIPTNIRDWYATIPHN